MIIKAVPIIEISTRMIGRIKVIIILLLPKYLTRTIITITITTIVVVVVTITIIIIIIIIIIKT